MKYKNSVNNWAFLYIAIGIFFGWIITAKFLSPNQSGYQFGTRTMMGSGYRNATNIDQHFIEQMIPHHEDAITMANLALSKSKKPEIKILAQNILKSQGDEITQMTQWYVEWFGQTVPSGATQMGMHGMTGSGNSLHMGLLGNETDINSLDSALDFDKEFIRQMIPHHQMAIMMANMLENSSDRSEMRELAKNIISSQSKEIEDMRSWYGSWYK